MACKHASAAKIYLCYVHSSCVARGKTRCGSILPGTTTNRRNSNKEKSRCQRACCQNEQSPGWGHRSLRLEQQADTDVAQAYMRREEHTPQEARHAPISLKSNYSHWKSICGRAHHLSSHRHRVLSEMKVTFRKYSALTYKMLAVTTACKEMLAGTSRVYTAH